MDEKDVRSFRKLKKIFKDEDFDNDISSYRQTPRFLSFKNDKENEIKSFPNSIKSQSTISSFKEKRMKDNKFFEYTVNFSRNYESLIQEFANLDIESNRNAIHANTCKSKIRKENEIEFLENMKINKFSLDANDKIEEIKVNNEKKTKKSNKPNRTLIKELISSYSKNSNKEELEEIKSLSNIEDIRDFYSYTDECFLMISKISTPSQDEIIELQNQVTFPEYLKSKKIVIFDLDETLIHCDYTNPSLCDQVLYLKPPNGGKLKIGINLRPGLKECLKEIRKNFELIVYTASHKIYADVILDFIDHDKSLFCFRLYRNNCIQAKVENEKVFIKDLRIFKDFDLRNIVIIDNSVLSFAYHLDNGIPILPFYDNRFDNELFILDNYLKFLVDSKDMRKENIKHMRLNHLLRVKTCDFNSEYDSFEDSLRARNDDDINISERSFQRLLLTVDDTSSFDCSRDSDKNLKFEECIKGFQQKFQK